MVQAWSHSANEGGNLTNVARGGLFVEGITQLQQGDQREDHRNVERYMTCDNGMFHGVELMTDF